jgi:hypothetical protein
MNLTKNFKKFSKCSFFKYSFFTNKFKASLPYSRLRIFDNKSKNSRFLIQTKKSFTEKNTHKIDLIEEFEKCMDEDIDDQEKRVKLLSLRLLQCNRPEEVLSIFDDKFLKTLKTKIYGEELVLFIYFYTSLIEKSLSEGEKIKLDRKLSTLLLLIFERIDELDMPNLQALSWACSLLISKHSINLDYKFIKKLLDSLPDNLDLSQKGEVPTLCLSISSFSDNLSDITEKDSVENLLIHKIEQYSKFFCKYY